MIEVRNLCFVILVVEKVFVGVVEYMKIVRVVNLRRIIEELKEKGIWVFVIDVSGLKFVYECDFIILICIVIGFEGKGIFRFVKEGVDFLIKIL